ncbi:MarR family winged helix-turn-helix transcriptional regulator [Oceanirhabdus sp. W0125-5]|uniref:MarR family winged helix-turn-helix transcriptional regulator n=1 Tax=Oceanirhabdus sp. W0125-5 TaxID=2999116 RepID=UPI0022F2B518|nr:MarR family transcriptional regulator [Oceanirhabdus sp. W0125-5]WBW99687.1 MarR family transcriptional regulator [Oceanirhabdus sp. W0125-5]
MNKSFAVLNELLVDLFNDILIIEQNALAEGKFNDLSITEIHTIEEIGMYGSRTMSEIAMDLGITVGTLTIAMNNLVKKGYVNRQRSDRDRRVVEISLTRKGKLAFRVHEKFHTDMIKNTIEGLTEEEEVVLNSALEKLNKFFKSNYNIKRTGKKE